MKTSFFLVTLMIACGSDNGRTGDQGIPQDMATPPAPTCASFCTAVLANCVGSTMGVDAGVGLTAFNSLDSCMNACAKFPVGTAADIGGNTLGCRANQARL